MNELRNSVDGTLRQRYSGYMDHTLETIEMVKIKTVPIETFPPASRHQPESDGDSMPSIDKVDRGQLVNYSEQEQYLYRRAAGVALEVFGEDLSRPGIFFAEAGSDHDVPYMVACEGQGSVTSYHLFDGGKAGGRGLNGVVITEAEALDLRAAALGRTTWDPFANL